MNFDKLFPWIVGIVIAFACRWQTWGTSGLDLEGTGKSHL